MDSELQRAIERMDHFPGEDLELTHEPGFGALQALVAERGADELLGEVPELAEVRHDVGRQVVGLVTAEALFVGALAAASATRKRGAARREAHAGFETLTAATGLLAGDERQLTVQLEAAERAVAGLADLVTFAAGRLALAACRADARLAGAADALGRVALREVRRGAVAELFLAGETPRGLGALGVLGSEPSGPPRR